MNTIENLENAFCSEKNTKIVDGLLAIHLLLTASVIGSNELLKELENVGK